ncbi:MAG: hypothetical protein IKD02_07200 [Clostridia bacterium]|nr:hypothetical protein [Clostridia bacterium]
MIGRKQPRRARLFLVFLLLLSLLLGIGISAEEDTAEKEETEEELGDAMPKEFLALLESLPEELLALLPEGIFSQGSEEVGEAVREMGDFFFLLEAVLSLCGLRLRDCVGILASVLGILLLSAISQAVASSLGSKRIGQAFSLCSSLVILLSLISVSYRGFSSVSSYFATLNGMSAALLPLMGVLYAMGGNLSAATASTAGLSVFMTLIEELVGKTVLPLCGICLAFSLISALEGSPRLDTLIASLKKNYLTAISFLMTLLLAMLGTQTTLGARADGLAMRGVKFAAGNLIPVVGGSVGELLRTVSASVGYLRGTVGMAGILFLLLALLPTLLELLLLRMTWQIAASAAEMLGCTVEKKLLTEFASLVGYLIAAVSICSAILPVSLTLLALCASALS